MHGGVNARAHPGLIAGKYALDDAVKAELLEMRAVGLNTDPAVVIEYIGALTVAVYKVNQLFAKACHKLLGKLHIITLVGCGRHVGDLKAALVDEILGGQRIAVSGGKIVQCLL